MGRGMLERAGEVASTICSLHWRGGFLCRGREGLEEWPLGLCLLEVPIARTSLLLR